MYSSTILSLDKERERERKAKFLLFTFHFSFLPLSITTSCPLAPQQRYMIYIQWVDGEKARDRIKQHDWLKVYRVKLAQVQHWLQFSCLRKQWSKRITGRNISRLSLWILLDIMTLFPDLSPCRAETWCISSGSSTHGVQKFIFSR